MPLYEDSKITPIKIEDLEGKEAIEKYSNPMVWRIPNTAFYWSPENNKIMKRNETPILPIYAYRKRDKKEIVNSTIMLRYAESAMPAIGVPGQTNYQPDFIVIPGKGTLLTTERDFELNLFLANHPANGSNPHRDPKKDILFQLHDKEEVAKQKLQKATTRFAAERLVYGAEALTRDELEKVAYQFFYADATLYGIWEEPNAMSEESLRVLLGGIAVGDPKKFLNYVGTTQSPMRELINNCTKAKLLVFDDAGRTWYAINEQNMKEKLLEVKPGTEAGAEILNFLEGANSKGAGQLLQTRLSRVMQKA